MSSIQRPIPSSPGYLVTDDGRIISTKNWRGLPHREMCQAPNHSGYQSVRLWIDKKRKIVPVQRLVAEVFLPDRPTHNFKVKHLDGDRTNNHWSNLYWGTKYDRT
jgi:hypothetical protein